MEGLRAFDKKIRYTHNEPYHDLNRGTMSLSTYRVFKFLQTL